MANEDWDAEIGDYMERIDIALGGYDLEMTFVDVWVNTAASHAAVGTLLLIAGAAYAVAWNTELHSFWNLLALAVSPAVFFFALAPAVIRIGRRHPGLVPVGGGLMAFALLVAARYCDQMRSTLSATSCEFVQATLIEGAVALLMLASFEVAVAPRLEALNSKLERAREANKRATEEIDAWRERMKKRGLTTP